MTLLLDTHVALWAVFEPTRLSAAARAALLDEEHRLAVSVISVWEIAIKHALRRRGGHDAYPFSGTQALAAFKEATYDVIGITPRHAVAVDALPRLHGDPFDRLLIAQAKAESARLITHDALLGEYGDFVQLV